MQITHKKLLFITEDFPAAYSGTTVRSRFTIDALLELGLSVDVVCFVFSQNEHAPFSHQQLKIYSVPVAKTPRLSFQFLQKLIQNTFTLYPFAIKRVYKPQFSATVSQLIKKNAYDLVIISGTSMLQYFPKTNLPVCFMLDEDHTDLFRQRFYLEKNFLKKMAHLVEYFRSLIFERKYLPRLSQLWAISPRTQKRLGKISGVPSPIMPTQIPLMNNVYTGSAKTIVFTGTLSWPENIEGLRWFLETQWQAVLAAVPHTRLVIIGQGASLDFQNYLASFKNVVVKGFVERLDHEYADASLAIAPVRINAGIKVKILTYLSYGIPVVSTQKAAWGLESTHGLLVASDKLFAKTVVLALKNKNMRALLSVKAHQNITNNYSKEKLHSFITDRLFSD